MLKPDEDAQYYTKHRVLNTWPAAALLSIVVNLAQILEWVRSGGLSHRLFNDWDEPVYLKWMYDIGAATLGDFSAARSDLSSILFPNFHFLTPQLLSDMLIGRLAHALGLEAASSGLLLDLVLFALVYRILCRAFVLLSSKPFVAETAALGMLCLPWLAAPGTYFHFPLPEFDTVVSARIIGFVSLPVQRAVYTQLSYVFFALWLAALLRAWLKTGNEKHYLRWAGVWAGLSIYTYFFAWAAMTGVSMLMVAAAAPAQREKSPAKLRMFRMAQNVAPNLLVVLPAIILIVAAESGKNLTLEPELLRYHFFSLEWLLFFIAFLVIRYFARGASAMRVAADLLIACSVAEIVFMNLQPVFKQLLTPYHFSVFYLYPLASGVLILLAVNVFSSPRLSCLACSGVFLVVMAVVVSKALTGHAARKKEAEFIELIGAVREKTADGSVVVVIPYTRALREGCADFIGNQRLMPFWIRALANRQVLPYSATLSGDDLEIHRELALGWIFSGTVRLLRECGDQPPKLPGDIASGVRTFIDLSWTKFSYRAMPEMAGYPACRIIKDFRLDYILWEEEAGIKRPDDLPAFTKSLWKSKGGAYELLAVDREIALKKYCGT